MDEFVNWDNAAAADYPLFPEGDDLAANDPSLSMDLALESVNDDEFGFFALQRFNDDHALPGVANVDAQLGTLPAQVDSLDTPLFACGYCATAGHQCKTIREGKHSGFCTSCVALGFQCRFGDTIAPPAFSEPAPLQQPSWAARLEEQACSDLPAGSEPEIHANSFNQLPQLSSAGAPPPLMAPKPLDPSLGQHPPTPVGKVGARLSRESIRVLRQWLSTHSRHPYPSDEEKDMLQRQTGLTKTQITNWLANARRRHKFQPPRSTSPQVGSSIPMDIPPRKGTPAPEANISLQRWVDSPPENEPASAIAIARAVTASTGSPSEQASPFSSNVYTDDGSGRSLQGSSASSAGTSHSSLPSNSSVWSRASTRNSFGSIGTFSRNRRRRRRRNAPKNPDEKTSLAPQLKTYQCTFCTETFKTKHDWGRHEKSLHLSLERWVCSNHGPKVMKADINKVACVFCGEPEPSDDHIESHNHSACLEKPLDARTFYRKDHLNQHLKLVHNVKFAGWSMSQWKVATPSIRSRCGFCGIIMDSWCIRQDHLAEHFKMGYGMEDWKGDWGFERPVLDQVENSIPPCMRPIQYPVDRLQNSNF
ncbi:MAG: homeobox domain-containing protein [Acidobacteria bacterium]|nr:homeobox domain-containing protein [Acidobacteriota bacterium]